jgi:alanyl-tRNA synthetase
VLRRIMRRAIRFGEKVGLENLFFHEVCKKVVEEFGEAYPNLVERAATIDEVVRGEEESFRRTLKRGLRLFEGAVSELPAGETAFPLGVAAELYDTYGLPIDLTGILSREKGLTLDEEAVKQEVQARQSAGAAAANLGGGDKAIDNLYFRFKERFAGAASFTGYGELSTRGNVLALAVGGVEKTAAQVGDEVEFITDATPFYGESGGQVGDTGIAEGDGVRVEISDTIKPTGDLHIHRGKVTQGTLEVGRLVTLTVDGARRAAIRRNHSATHLLHHALRAVLGTHVAQKGSLVAPDRLRFDFSHPRPITPEQKQQIERIVNEMTLANADTDTREMSPGEAKSAGAIGLFEAKYGEQVRVVRIGSDSVELCGGTHVHRAGDIGLFAIVSEVGIAQGVRRIEAVTGMNALRHLQDTVKILDEAAGALHASGPGDVMDKLGRLQASALKREREIGELQRKLAVGGGGSADTIADVGGVKLLAKVVAVADPKALREAADTLRDRLGSGVIVLGAEKDGKASLLVAVTKDLAGKVHAGNLIAALAAHVGGRGGGRPDLAQAGGPNASGLPAAIDAASSALAAQLA